MPSRKRRQVGRTIDSPEEQTVPMAGEVLDDADSGDEAVPEGHLVCALTREHRVATPQEETLQSFIEQFHQEYGVALEDMERDVRVSCVSYDEVRGRNRTRARSASLAVYESGKPHTRENMIRVAVVAKPGTKADGKTIGALEEILGSLADDRAQVFGLWTNGADLAFRMRTFDKRTGHPHYTTLTDIPGPDEDLADLDAAERRPLRVAAGDSLLRAFKRCHDYLYGNQSMRPDRAFWQLLYLIFCKIHDEHQGGRRFFVGATEGNTVKGQNEIAARIKALFETVKTDAYPDVFDGSERIELNERALAFVAGVLSRYSLLSTDTDAKGMAYEAITSSTLKRERGQFFTPRNVIRMMVEMLDPRPAGKVLDPACGSGGFLVVALAHLRRYFLRERGSDPDVPVPSELKRIGRPLQTYARQSLWGIDVDPELRKAARMNMVMNNDGHGNIYCFNGLEFGVRSRETDEMRTFARKTGGHDAFDYVFTNPPFGSKIPVTDPDVLDEFDLGHAWTRDQGVWRRGPRLAKVPPEILFIEACYKFLKPGTGVMAIVVPDGILGNPGEQMEGVRWWMLNRMELLASVDLPAETFLPQVSVQASCVFLRRRDSSELQLMGTEGPPQRPVFMAIAEQCGHGRRGETRYVRAPDGTEVFRMKEVVERREQGSKIIERRRKRELRELADDLPWIAEQYRRLAAGGPFETA
jgi:type I restriction enzyme M protein